MGILKNDKSSTQTIKTFDFSSNHHDSTPIKVKETRINFSIPQRNNNITTTVDLEEILNINSSNTERKIPRLSTSDDNTIYSETDIMDN